MSTLCGLTMCRGNLCSEIASDTKDVVAQGICIIFLCVDMHISRLGHGSSKHRN